MQLKSYYTVRFNDCDPFGILNNARYIDYMLNAREDHLKEHYQLSLADYHKQGMGWVVRRHEIQYVRPAYYNERIGIVSRLATVDETDLRVEMLMFDETLKTLKALCWTIFTCIDMKTGRRKEHTPEFLEFARSIEEPGINFQAGIAERVKELATAVQEA